MDGVTVIDHPLVQHKLTIMRKKETSTGSFRRLLREISTLLCYEVTRDLPLEQVPIATPLEPMMAPRIAGRKLVLAPVLRAGLGMLEGMVKLLPTAEVGFLGMKRDEETLQPETYAERLPDDLAGRQHRRHRS